jgi:RNA polymerase sigma factor (sigma-70 family)
MTTSYDFLLQNEQYIRRQAMHAANNDPQLADELYSEAINVMPGIVERWDGATTSLRTWAMLNIKWTWYKYKTRMRRYLPLLDGEEPFKEAAHDELESLELVQKALQSLDDECRYIVIARYYQGKTFQSIADELGVSKGTVINRHYAAL